MTTDQALDLLVSIERYNTGTLRNLRRDYKVQNYKLLRDEASNHKIGNDEYADALVRLALNRLDSLFMG